MKTELKPRPVRVKSKKNYTFLIIEENKKMPKNPAGLKLFTKTWPPKRESKTNEENTRPLTATLDKPSVLDINFMGIIDMSTMRKEFLNISNLCRFPISLTITKRKKSSSTALNRPLSLPSPDKHKIRQSKKRPETSEDSYTEAAKYIKKIDAPKSKNDPNNNYKTFRIPRKRVSNVVKLLDLNKNDLKSTKLPEPCKTCGRPDQPERFHSHPATPAKFGKKPNEEPPKIMKSSVQKPVAIKYKSKQAPPPPVRKPSLPAQKLVHTPPNTRMGESPPVSRVKSAKRTLTCYICGREFGTASLPLHEPKCLQKWERENDALPSDLRRKVPIKPDHNLTPEEWNKCAWETAQATLIPCGNCGRTFFPDRLVVHQRSCKDNVRK